MGQPGTKEGLPRIVGRYAIYDALASGGMATVHYGRLLGPVGFSRTVAIKRLHPQFAQDPEFVTMFLDEARMAARIRHPNVVPTVDVVTTKDETLLVMDYIHGDTLGEVLAAATERGEVVPPPIALRIASDTLQGLHAAHEATDEQGAPLHLVHRDISPHNIMLGADGVARLVDFGVAKASGRSSATRKGHIKGKLCYMAPEQLQGQSVTRQADIHAFGIVLWEMLAGRKLFVGDSETEVVGAVVRHEIPSLTKLVSDLPPSLDIVVRRSTAVKLETRFASARDMCIALDRCGPMAPTRAVADWVVGLIKETLDARQKAVTAIEREPALVAAAQTKAPPEAKPAAVQSPVVGGSAPPAETPVASAKPRAASDAGTPAAVTVPLEGGPRDSSPERRPSVPEPITPAVTESPVAARALDAETADVPLGVPRSPPRPLVWGAAALSLALLLAAVWKLTSSGPETSRSVAMAATSSVAPPSTTAPVVTPAPVVTAAPAAPSATPAAALPPVAPVPAGTKSVVSAPAGTEMAAPHPAPARRPAKPNCDPPFTVDQMGVRVPKRECF